MKILYVVNDPENSDATFGPADEAELWLVDERPRWRMGHTGTAEEDGTLSARMSLQALIQAAVALFDNNEYSGDVAVVRSDKLEALQLMLRKMNLSV